MNAYVSEVLPAVAATIVMGLSAILLFIVFETLRNHVQIALRNRKEARAVEQSAVETSCSTEGSEGVEESPATELQFDGDAGMFEGDFADTPQAPLSSVTPEAVGNADDDDTFFAEPQVLQQDNVPAPRAQPERAGVVQDLPCSRDSKQNRREREANVGRRDRKAEKQRQRGGKERDAAPDDARKMRQQNKRRNSQ